MLSVCGPLSLVNKCVSERIAPMQRILIANTFSNKEITKAYAKVIELFKNNMVLAAKAPLQHGGPSDSSVTATTQDIVILLLPYLSSADANALFKLCMTMEVLGGKDNGVQKRGYKIVSKLVESGKISVDAEAIMRQLDELSDGLAAAAKKVLG